MIHMLHVYAFAFYVWLPLFSYIAWFPLVNVQNTQVSLSLHTQVSSIETALFAPPVVPLHIHPPSYNTVLNSPNPIEWVVPPRLLDYPHTSVCILWSWWYQIVQIQPLHHSKCYFCWKLWYVVFFASKRYGPCHYRHGIVGGFPGLSWPPKCFELNSQLCELSSYYPCFVQLSIQNRTVDDRFWLSYTLASSSQVIIEVR